MTIRGFEGERLTPKQMAQDLLLASMVTAMYRLNELEGLTDRERAQVEDQLQKQLRRVEKLFGYTPGSWKFG